LKGKAFRTKTLAGLPTRTSVSLDENGTVFIVQRFFMKEEHPTCMTLRKWKGHYYVHREMGIRRESMGNIMAIISKLINEMKLYKKFPENFKIKTE
jgi:hypothetical protein